MDWWVGSLFCNGLSIQAFYSMIFAVSLSTFWWCGFTFKNILTNGEKKMSGRFSSKYGHFNKEEYFSLRELLPSWVVMCRWKSLKNSLIFTFLSHILFSSIDQVQYICFASWGFLLLGSPFLTLHVAVLALYILGCKLGRSGCWKFSLEGPLCK